MRWLRQWGPAIAWACVIWIFSTQAFSALSTSRVIVPVLHWVLPQASIQTVQTLHFFIRKSAHFVEYFIFSLLLVRGVRGGRSGWSLRWGLAAVAMAACYAILDEVHQAFVPERTASPFDSMLDTAGAVTAQVVAWAQVRRQGREPERRAIGYLP